MKKGNKKQYMVQSNEWQKTEIGYPIHQEAEEEKTSTKMIYRSNG
jgi:hypothetical protein